MKKRSDKLWDTLGEILAVALVIIYLLSLFNAQFSFIQNQTILSIMSIMRHYGALLLVAVVGMEAFSKRAFPLRLAFYIAIGIIVLFLFFPATYQNLFS